MNVFQLFTEHVRAAVSDAGQGRHFPEPARSGAHRGRAAARGEPRRSRHQRRDGARQGRRPEAPRSRREDRGGASQAARGDQGRHRGAGLHQPDARSGGVARARSPPSSRRARTTAAAHVGASKPVNVEYVSANPTGPMHVGHCRGAVFGDALANLLGGRGLCGDARVLHQRRRRAGRRAGALGVPALPRGARREHRRDPGGALSRRLPQAGRRGARRRVRRQAQGDAGGAMAAARSRQGDRHDDGR